MKNSQKKSFNTLKKHQLKQIVGGIGGTTTRKPKKAISDILKTDDSNFGSIIRKI